MTHEQELLDSLKEINLVLKKFIPLIGQKGFENKRVLKDLSSSRETLERLILSFDRSEVDFGSARMANYSHRNPLKQTYKLLKRAAERTRNATDMDLGEQFSFSDDKDPPFYKKQWLKWVGAVALVGSVATAITIVYKKMVRAKSLRDLRKPLSDLVLTCEEVSNQILNLLNEGSILDLKTKATWLELEDCFYSLGNSLQQVHAEIR